MVDEDHRYHARDSMFLLASVRIDGQEADRTVKIRNLSSTGLMAEGIVTVRPGSKLAIEIRNIGWVTGSVAWVLDKRFGLMLDVEIDPRKARIAV